MVPQTERRTSLPDGIGWGERECSADKVPETLIFIAKRQINLLPRFVLNSYPRPAPPVVTPWT